MVTQHHCQMAGRPSALSTQWLASPSPSSSSLPWCKGSWCSARGGPLCTSTRAGAFPSHWWPSFTPLCSPRWPSLASSSSPLPSSHRWRRTGTSWSPSTSALFPSAPSAWGTTYPERPLIRSSGSSTKWASLVSADDSSYLERFPWHGGGSWKVSNYLCLLSIVILIEMIVTVPCEAYAQITVAIRYYGRDDWCLCSSKPHFS